MEPPVVAIVFFALLFGTIMRWLKYREKRLEAGGSPKELEALREERKQLVSRIENLESIVCDVDHELNVQIRRLVARSEQSLPAAAEPAAPPAPAPSAPTPITAAARIRGGARPVPPAAESTALDVRRDRSVPSVGDELPIGSVVENRYRITRLLGRGGMGAVYLASDEVLGEPVALKVISSALQGDGPETVERFRREASAARKISSPNVIRIHDLGQTRSGQLYLSMEYFPGETLAALLARRGPVDVDEAGDVIGQICDGLAAAHDVGVVHRDLKPHNVLVGERNAVKLIDFGLAKISFLDGMTATGLIMGTPEYMSPEQIKGAAVDARSDIYALGALTYHVLTGQPPFSGATPIAIGFAHVNDTPRPPRQLRPDIPAGLNDAILAALAKNPADRPRTAAEFRRALGPARSAGSLGAASARSR